MRLCGLQGPRATVRKQRPAQIYPQVPLAMMHKNVDTCAMSFRVPVLLTSAVSATAMLASPVTHAQEGTAAEMQALRQKIDLQAKQIEQLSAQVARLSTKIEGHADPATPAPAAPPASDSAEFAVPAARVVTPPTPAKVHIVVKGESLEKIAKSHGSTSVELQKLNRITDPKKLQIGQQLTLPSPNPKK